MTTVINLIAKQKSPPSALEQLIVQQIRRASAIKAKELAVRAVAAALLKERVMYTTRRSTLPCVTRAARTARSASALAAASCAGAQAVRSMESA
eukprot:916275-Prymnesium_polylepis.1